MSAAPATMRFELTGGDRPMTVTATFDPASGKLTLQGDDDGEAVRCLADALHDDPTELVDFMWNAIDVFRRAILTP
jgi:hypothetical protein